jgi:hypothetical protein
MVNRGDINISRKEILDEYKLKKHALGAIPNKLAKKRFN